MARVTESARQNGFRALLIVSAVVGIAMDFYGDVGGDRYTELGSSLAVSALVGFVILELQNSVERARKAADAQAHANELKETKTREAARDQDARNQSRLLLQVLLSSSPDRNFEGINLAGREMMDMFMRNLNLRDANLNNADLRNVDFSGADLRGATFRGARLTSARMRGARASGADFAGASADGVDFSGAELSNATFDGADITDSVFDEARIDDCSFENARGSIPS